MPKLSITFASAALTVALAPAAQAYGVEPDYTVMQVAMIEAEPVPAGETCTQPLPPELIAVLALPTVISEAELTKLACAQN